MEIEYSKTTFGTDDLIKDSNLVDHVKALRERHIILTNDAVKKMVVLVIH